MDKNSVIEKIINESLDKIMAERFGRYSKYIIQQRALPDVRDGLKPVQRRILYSMYELGLFHNKPFKKSARVVGDVIGRFHPHGDSSVYEAMVNMAQWWKNSMPLVDMHGNVGSIDNDSAAAMRYTEARMSRVAELILGELKKNPVNFVPNFDDSELEPAVLPSIFPNLLINGTTGIAIGMATEMPPHNFEEIIDATIAKLQNPNLSFSQLCSIVKGPDFPTGGIIYGTKGIEESFETGRTLKNKIQLFSKFVITSDNKNKYIEITEIPYGVVKSDLVYSIDVLISQNEMDGVLEIKDQSDREGIKIVITLEKDANEKSIMRYLFSKTKLQINYSYNNMVIKNNSPQLLNLNNLITSYVEHISDIKTKTLTYDVEKHKLRLEIVLGFLKVTEITDEIIEVIRKSEGSKAGVIQDLMNIFGFTKNQATAIAELRLYKLSKTDYNEFKNEKDYLENEINYINSLLEDKDKFTFYLINLLKELRNEFPSPRRTQIVDREYNFDYDEKDLIKEEIINVAISKFGYIKRLSQKVIESNDFSTYVLKDEDYLTFYNQVNTMDTFLIFTNFGNYAIIPIYKIEECKWKDNGIHLSDFVDLQSGEVVVSVIEVSDWNSNLFVTIATRNGIVKRTPIKEFEVSRTVKTYTAISISNDDRVVNACLSNGSKDIILVSSFGLCNKYTENDINIYGTKAKGIKGANLGNNDYIVAFTVAQNNDVLTLLTEDGMIKKIRAKDILYVSKNNKGKPLFKNRKFEPYIINEIYSTRDSDVILVRDKEGLSHLDSIKQYSFSKTDDKFSKIKVENFAYGVIKKTQKTIKEEINFESESQSEVEIIEDVNKKIDMLDSNIEELLAKIEKTLNEK